MPTNDERRAADPATEDIAAISGRADSEAVRAARRGRGPGREGLDRELREIKDDVLRMGALVEEALRAAIDALERRDAEAAMAVILGDDRINEMQRGISGAVTATIATQSPV